jgi:hypothetical protein
MKRKRGRPQIEKVNFSQQRFQEALEYREKSLRQIQRDNIDGLTERTLRRAKKDGKINPEILDLLGKYLDIDPYFLSGGYDESADRVASTPEESRDLKAKITVNQAPYIRKEKRELKSLGYIEDILIDHEIPISVWRSMPIDTMIHFYLDMDRAIDKVVWKYFDYPEHLKHESSYPMPPEDEIISSQ